MNDPTPASETPIPKRPTDIPFVESVADFVLPPEEVAFAKPAKRPGFSLWIALLWSLLYLLVTQILAGIMGVVYILAEHSFDQQVLTDLSKNQMTSHHLMVLLGFSQIGSILFAFVLLRFGLGKFWPRLVSFRLPHWNHILIVLLALPAWITVGNSVYLLAQSHIPSLSELIHLPTSLEETLKQTQNWPWWMAALLIGLGPAIGEELFFRGYIGQGLIARYGFIAGVCITSVLFGVVHVDPPQAVYAIVGGIFLHLLYIASRSLLLPMLLHFLNNGVNILSVSDSACVPLVPSLELSFERNPFFILAAAFFQLFVIGWFLYETRAKLEAKSDNGLVWEPEAPSLASPPKRSETRIAYTPASTGILFAVIATTILFGVAWVLA